MRFLEALPADASPGRLAAFAGAASGGAALSDGGPAPAAGFAACLSAAHTARQRQADTPADAEAGAGNHADTDTSGDPGGGEDRIAAPDSGDVGSEIAAVATAAWLAVDPTAAAQRSQAFQPDLPSPGWGEAGNTVSAAAAAAAEPGPLAWLPADDMNARPTPETAMPAAIEGLDPEAIHPSPVGASSGGQASDGNMAAKAYLTAALSSDEQSSGHMRGERQSPVPGRATLAAAGPEPTAQPTPGLAQTSVPPSMPQLQPRSFVAGVRSGVPQQPAAGQDASAGEPVQNPTSVDPRTSPAAGLLAAGQRDRAGAANSNPPENWGHPDADRADHDDMARPGHKGAGPDVAATTGGTTGSPAAGATPQTGAGALPGQTGGNTPAAQPAHSGAQPTGVDPGTQSAGRIVLDARQADAGRHLAERLVEAIASGRSELEISLRPRNLGALDIRVQINDARVTVRIRAETLAATQLLASGEESLKQAFDASGLRLAAITTQTNPIPLPTGLGGGGGGGWGGGQGGAQQQGGQAGQGRNGHGEASSAALRRAAPGSGPNGADAPSQLAHRTLVINLIA